MTNALLISCAGAIFVFYFSWVQFRTLLKSLDVDLNIENLTPADYTVALTGAPMEEMSEDEIKNILLSNINSNPTLTENGTKPIQIFKVVLAYDLTKFIKLGTEIAQLRADKHVI